MDSLRQRDAPVLPQRPVARIHLTFDTPQLVFVAGELRPLVRDQMLRRAMVLDGVAECLTNLLAARLLPEHANRWVSWLPEAVRQSWPFGWWFLVVIDLFEKVAEN